MRQYHLHLGHMRVLNHGTVSIRCPSCKQNGSFEPILADINDLDDGDPEGRLAFLQRQCPNEACRAHVFVVVGTDTNPVAVEAVYPPEIVDFDATAIPEAIERTFAEALTCHSVGANIAAAIMVRRTLEEICADRSAQGENLYARIEALSSEVTMPQQLLDGAQILRLLGNDAAHVESRQFDEIGDEELGVAIDFAKELMKATYQYAELVQRLSDLRTDPAAT